eukprot:658806_1
MDTSVSQEDTNTTPTKKETTDALNKMQERWLQIPVDCNPNSFTDFRGLINKQRVLFSDNPEDIQLDDNTLLSRFKQLIGPKQPYNPSNAAETADTPLSTLHEDDPASSASVLYYDEAGESVRMENNKPSLDYIGRFWMSDKNCTQCSECGATFHTFRRKHHCRLCGRVFCQTCCSERMNINKFKKLKNEYNIATTEITNNNTDPGMMRVCVFCSRLKTNDALLGIGMSYPNNIDLDGIKKIESVTYNACMNEIYDLHMKHVIKQLCGFEKLKTEWEQLIYDYSVRANDTILPDIIHSRVDFNDIRHYVKVKRISGGCISQCLFVDGVICRKNVAHRKMRTDIICPSILLLDSAIEYHRMNSKFHSFDILLKQNEEYMRMIVNKICDLGPDIVVVSNQVSRLALREMCAENITLICNVDISTMERIARAIGAPIIGSIDHMNQLDASVALGHCGHFYVQYYNEDPVGNKGRRTPLMFFDECGSNQHCTILLRGDDRVNLLKVKNVIRLAMHTLYHLKFEKSLCLDFNAAATNESIESIQNENSQHLFLSTSPFIGYAGWRRENVIAKLKRLHASKEADRFPHLATYPYNHHGIGDNVNELGIWDPFLPNTDNPWICQTLLVNHCRVINQQQCFPPKLKLIDFYTELDVNLGQYLVDMFSNKACCNPRCREPLSAHLLTYSHCNKTISIKLKLLQDLHEEDDSSVPIHRRHPDLCTNDEIIQWTRCKKCKFKTAPKAMSDRTFCLSFGKFLEMEFYSNPALPCALSSTKCEHSIFGHHVKYFAWNDEANAGGGDMIIEIDSESKQPFTVFTSKDITTNWSLQFKYYVNELNLLELVSKYVFAAFLVKVDELRSHLSILRCPKPIREDFNTLRREMIDECEKIETQFVDHRDSMRKGLSTSIPFLNKKRYHLYRISSEWNELLDGLRRSLLPNESNVDDTHRWMKKFKAPFKGLRSKVGASPASITHADSSPSITPEEEEEDDSFDAALQEIDDTIATIRRSSSSQNNTPQNINNDKTYNVIHVSSSDDAAAAAADKTTAIRDLSFMVDFNKMFDETAGLSCDSPNELSLLKIPGRSMGEEEEEKKYDLLKPQQVSDQSYLSGSAAEEEEEEEDRAIIQSPISTQLFAAANNAQQKQSVSLADVDFDRLKQESLFLVAACTAAENSSEIGSNPCYAHLNLPQCFENTVIPIYIDEPSAIIAYTLCSLEYHCVLNNIATQQVRSCRQRGDPSVQVLEKMVRDRQKQRRVKVRCELETRGGAIDIQNELDLNDLLYHIPPLKHVSKMEYLEEKKEYELQLKKHNKKDESSLSGEELLLQERHNDGSQALKFQFIDPGYFKKNNNLQQEQQLLEEEVIENHNKSSYVSTTFSCHVYYPHQFRALRRRLYDGEDDFIQSLSRCQSWNTSGGKSGSTFKKTLDHRFVLKFVKQNEFKMFLDNAQSYFEHMASVLFKHYPSVLVHILGVFQISWTKSNSSKSNKFAKYVIVMPNLWYSKNITKQFDLKGSLRNRYVSAQHDVMLDKNFIEYMNGFPMTLEDQSKQNLHKAVHNDTLFLCRSDVIDYSLLVGINQSNNELVVGIIDYLRTYTWDKAVEEQAKSIGMVIGKQAPTIQRPKNYKQRFREAMERYFMVAPDRKTKRINRPKDKSLHDAVRDILIQIDPKS